MGADNTPDIVQEPEIQHIAINNGLEVVCAPTGEQSRFPVAFPVSVHLKSPGGNNGVNMADGEVKVFVSKTRLRAMLDMGQMPDLLCQLLEGDIDHLKIMPPTSALLGRIVADIRNAPHTGAARALYLQGKVLELLAESLALENEAARQDASASENQRRWVMEARAVLLDDPADPPGINELALRVGISSRKLNLAFRNVCSMTAFEWLADWKLSRAADLVREARKPTKEIAASLGYSHVNNFINAFTRKYGIPPARYRKQGAKP